MVDEGVECSPNKDLEELERLLAKDPQSHHTEIQVHSVIINPDPFIYTQLMSPLYEVFKTSKPCKVDRDIISPGRLSNSLQVEETCGLDICGDVHGACVGGLRPHVKGMEFEVSSTLFYVGVRILINLQRSILNRSNRILFKKMVEIFEMVDVARGSRLGAWLKACCLFILPSKSKGVVHEVIKSSVKDIVLIPSESEGIPDTMCDVHLVNNPTPLEAKDHFEIVINSNDDYSSSDDDSLYNENIDGGTTTHFDISLPDYEAFSFYDSHIEEISSGSTTTHFDISLPDYEAFSFYDVEDDHSRLLAYVVWIFLAYLTYPVIPPHLHSFGNEDTIFDPGITTNRFYSFKPGLSYRFGSVKKFNTHRSHLNECPMMINGKNTPILDVTLFHFYPP
nr:hypothetical protein [Tanacetum cinerariifolium]